MKKTDLHLHCMDKFDSFNDPKAVCEREKELGATAIALTQHGVNASKMDFKKAADACGLKFIPGIEAYVEFSSILQKLDIKTTEKIAKKRCHLIMLATDIVGDKAIDKAVSKSQDKDGYAVMSLPLLKSIFGTGGSGHGHVIASSACIQGVIAMVLRLNDEAVSAIKTLSEKKGKIGDKEDMSKELSALREKEKELSEKIRPLTAALRKEKTEKVQTEKDALMEEKRKVTEGIRVVEKSLAKLAELSGQISVLEKTLFDEEGLKKQAERAAKIFVEIYGDGNFYMEMQNHGIEKEAEIYPKEAEIARKLQIPLVATNDVHILNNSEDEVLRRQILKAMRFQKWEDVSDGDRELYIKTDEELTAMLEKILPEDAVKEAMENIDVITDRCNVVYTKENHYPKFQTKLTADEQLAIEIEKGIKWRFPEGMDEKHKTRLAYELGVIQKMGYSDYHLIVKDILEYNRLLGGIPADKIKDAPLTIEELEKYVKENGYELGFSTGPGRGSAVGSLVCYLLGITAIDPLKYDLLFERFLNIERVSMPDIDSDMAFKTRSKTIEYIKHKYGENAVCGITTKSMLAAKGAVRRVAKYCALSEGTDEKIYTSAAEKIAKAIPNEPNTTFSSPYGDGGTETVGSMLEKAFTDKVSKKVLSWAKAVEGSFTGYSSHAAGVVISDNDDISDYIPLRWNENLNILTSQYDAGQVEEDGLLKIDCLGLRTLDIITDTMQMVKKTHGIEIDPLKINLEDTAVYNHIFKKGMTNSVFQFESGGMKSMLRQFQPERFEDLIILVSMYRPGPMQFIPDVIEVKRGKEPEYVCKELEPILGNTYGAICYQEQVMAIFQQLAGYTLGGADVVRRYMSKKKSDKLKAEREAFIYGDSKRNIKGCVANEISEEAADKLFTQMEEFAKYAFNKSHATAYAFNAYVTAWLKHYYPAEFLAAALNWADTKKVSGLMHEAKILGIKVKAPDINRSLDIFSVENGEIYFGLKKVKSVGASAELIIKEREKNGRYISLRDFLDRTNCKKNVAQAICKAGGFDLFCDNRTAVCEVIPKMKEALKKVKEKKLSLDNAVANGNGVENAEKSWEKAKSSLDEIMVPTWMEEDKKEKMEEEKELLGQYVTSHPIFDYPEEPDGVTPISDLTAGNQKIQTVITKVDLKRRKADGKEFAICKCEDLSGEVTVKFFTKKYAFYKKALKEGNVLLLSGRVDEEDTGLIDEDGNAVMECSMTADSAKFASKKKTVLRMNVSSYPVFHIRDEEDFMKRYADPNGCIFEIYDKKADEIRRAKYKVSQKAEALTNVQKM